MADIVLMLGAIGVVILIAALTSGILDRLRLPQAAGFLLLGALFGPHALGLYDFAITSPTVKAVAALSLVLVLFIDSVGVNFNDLRKHVGLAAIILGPGTVITAILIGAASHWILQLGVAESVILGAALASTDPVLLRGVMRSPSLPTAARQALRIESGMNDAVLLPALLVAVALLAANSEHVVIADVVLRTLLLGIVIGAVVGFLAVKAMELVRRHIGIRRDYESLYVLAIALTAYAGAEAFHGSGFIAAFAAGIVVARMDVELCECFYDYGEASAEMALLFAFVILGNSAIWTGFDVVSPRVLLFSAVALFGRTVVLAATLGFARVDKRSRWIITWFGPRGLSSLLLVLLAVFAGVPSGAQLFAICSLVVLLSVVIHGGSQIFLRPARNDIPVITPSGMEAELVSDTVRITLDEVEHLQAMREDVRILDVRADASYRRTLEQPVGAVRVAPERATEGVRVMGLPPDAWLVLYCT